VTFKCYIELQLHINIVWIPLCAFIIRTAGALIDGQSGIELVQKVHPDLIILDLMMPNIDGFGVLDRLKADEALRNVPVVVVTAKDLTNDERARLTGQVQSLLSKGSFIDDAILQDLLKEKLR